MQSRYLNLDDPAHIARLRNTRARIRMVLFSSTTLRGRNIFNSIWGMNLGLMETSSSSFVRQGLLHNVAVLSAASGSLASSPDNPRYVIAVAVSGFGCSNYHLIPQP